LIPINILPGFLLVSIGISLLACSESNRIARKNDASVPDWQKLNGPNYSVQYPPDWELVESRQMGTDFMLFSPLESDSDIFKENVNLLVQDLSGFNLDLDSYVQMSEKQLLAVITDPVIIESKRMKAGSSDYHKFLYTGKQGQFKLKFEQYVWVEDKKAYILTLTCEDEKYSDYRETGEAILNSFSLSI
jgi:hypothetical protein